MLQFKDSLLDLWNIKMNYECLRSDYIQGIILKPQLFLALHQYNFLMQGIHFLN